MKNKQLAFLVVVFVILAGGVNAVPLAPGGNTTLTGTTVAVNPDLAGTVQEDPTALFGTIEFNAIFQGRVTLSDNLGTIIFSPRMKDYFVFDDFTWVLTGIDVKGFAGWTTDVDYRTDGLGDIGPGSVLRSGDGDVLMFDFTGNPVPDGNETLFLSILTNAPAYLPLEDGINFEFTDVNGVKITLALDYFMPADTLSVDIKPGSCPNPFNPKSKGSVPVAIVGSNDLDVTTIDVTTITLEGVPAMEQYMIADVTQANGDPWDCYDCFDEDDPNNYNCDLWDANDPNLPPVPGSDGILDSYCGDGYDDLIVKFDTQELAAAIGEVSVDDCVKLELIAVKNDGTFIVGSDSVVIKGKGRGKPE